MTRPRSALFPEQIDAARQISARDDPQVAILADIGFGKTAATLTGLVDRNEWPVLVVATARVAENVWQAEAAEWEHTEHLVVTPLGQGKGRDKRLALNSHIETISYEALMGQPDHPKHPFTGLTDEVRLEDRYKAIVFDELSKVKTPGTKRFRRLRAHAEGIQIRAGLTGSPVPNHLLDLWGMMFMVAGEKPLGRTFTGYQQRYFETIDYMKRVWRLKGMTEDGDHTRVSTLLAEEIYRRISPFCYVPPPLPPGRIPPVRVSERVVRMPASVERKQQQLEDELFTMLDSGVEIEAIEKSTLAQKLRQFASGAIYLDKECTRWEELHTAKIDALDEMLDDANGEPVLIFYWFRHEAERIAAMLKRTGRVHASIDDPGAIEAWNKRKLEAMLAHPQSAGHGLNLQHGGHHIAWFALPWPHELWKQGCGRLARTGQRAAFVTASCLLCGRTDARVLASLRRKGGQEEALLAALRMADLW